MARAYAVCDNWYSSVPTQTFPNRSFCACGHFEGKGVVITGASSGLGEATARFLSTKGATVVLGARRVDRLQSLADELNSNGGKALAVPTDVTDYDQDKKIGKDQLFRRNSGRNRLRF